MSTVTGWRKRTIMEMAKECDLIAGNAEHGIYIMALERFAALVREEAQAEEREAIIQEIPGGFSVDPQWVCDMIRARGQA